MHIFRNISPTIEEIVLNLKALSPLEPPRIAIRQIFVFIDAVEEAKKSEFDPTRLLKVYVHVVVLYNMSFSCTWPKVFFVQVGLQWT